MGEEKYVDKKEEDKKLKEVTDMLEEGIKTLFESERYENFLKTMSKFHTYSLNNSILIAMQKPDATYLAGYESWKKNFHRSVRPKERGIRIICPAPYKAYRWVEVIDPNTQKTVINSNGEPLLERKQVVIPAYKVGYTWDISQTEGKELPKIAEELKDNGKDYEELLKAIREASPVPMEFKPLNVNGFYKIDEKKICINENLESTAMRCKTGIHEIAHSIIHDKDTGIEKDVDPRTKEIESESIAYVVANHFGLDSSSYSWGYVAGYSKDKQLFELKNSLKIIRDTSADIINRIENALCRNRAKEKEKQPEQDPEKRIATYYRHR